MVYDSARARTVLFGGSGASNADLADTWEWDGSTWTQSVSSTTPSARSGHMMAYDSDRNRTVLFGGAVYLPSGYLMLGDTWEWDGVDWVERPTSGGPKPRWPGALAYDAARSRTVLFGGVTPGSPTTLFADTWEWDGSSWSLATAAVSPAPRGAAAMAHDGARGRTVLFGGRSTSGSMSTVLSDTWEWKSWTQEWPQASPPDRQYHGLAYDSARGLTVLFGGCAGVQCTRLNDTWEWDGTSWLQRAPATSPPARAITATAFDTTRERLVLFGGSGLTDRLGDAWEYGACPP